MSSQLYSWASLTNHGSLSLENSWLESSWCTSYIFPIDMFNVLIHSSSLQSIWPMKLPPQSRAGRPRSSSSRSLVGSLPIVLPVSLIPAPCNLVAFVLTIWAVLRTGACICRPARWHDSEAQHRSQRRFGRSSYWVESIRFPPPAYFNNVPPPRYARKPAATETSVNGTPEPPRYPGDEV